EFKGNSRDSNNNNSDFVLRTAPQPQNSASAKEFPFGGPGQSDSGAPQVRGSFPSGFAGETVPTNLSFIGFDFSESLDQSTVSTSTVKLLAGGVGASLCAIVSYSNFPTPGSPPGKCTLSGALSSSVIYTFRILGDSTNSSTSTAVRDLASNALNQPVMNNGNGSGTYQITFTPSGAGATLTFTSAPVMFQGSIPFKGSVNIPRNIKKIIAAYSGNLATSTVTTSNVTLALSGGAAVTLSSVTTASSEERYTSNAIIGTIPAATTLAANSTYVLTFSGLQDASGRSLQTETIQFSTGASSDTSGPQVAGKIPNDSTGVSVSAIDIHVMTDDRLDPSTISSSSVKLKKGANEVAGRVTFDPMTGEIILFANNVFQTNSQYTVSINATGSIPCVANISGLCLTDNDGTSNNLYEFSFTTGSADTTGPQVLFANADQRNLSITFNESVKETEAETLGNYTLLINGVSSTLSTNAGNTAFYEAAGRTVTLENLSLTSGATFNVTVANVYDLAGNIISVSASSSVGTVQSLLSTGGFIGPGGPGAGGDFATNFSSSSFSFVPQIEVRPLSPQVGATTLYFVDMPISKQVKISSQSGKIVLTFPSGFDVTSAAFDGRDPMAGDANGPGPGTLAPTLAVSASARTVTITLSSSTRCGSGNAIGCGGDTHDFLHFDIKGIINSSIPKDASSGGYTVDIKIMDGTTVLESLTSKAFYLGAGGTNALIVNLSASGATSGTSTVTLFSPMSGPRDAVSSAFAGGISTTTFTGLVEGDYMVFTDPIITLNTSIDYLGRSMPTPVRLSGNTTSTMTITLTSTASFATATIRFAGPANKNVDVFANSLDKFVVKATSTTGSSQDVILRLSDGTWFVGVGPQMPRGGFFEGKPPVGDFVMQPPVQVVVSGNTVTESSGIANNDGIIQFTLSAANQRITGTVKDASAKAIVGAEVFAFSPMGGFGTHGTTDASGAFSLNVGAGVYQMGAFAQGLPPSGEIAVQVTSDGSLVVDGRSAISVSIKLIKPERTISGKVLDQSNNPVQYAGVFAYCDPSVSANSCLGPGGQTSAPTGSDGSYTLYVKNGTWKVGAFVPGFGDLPTVTQVVSGSDISNLNFSPSTNTTFNSISGTVCRDDHASGNSTTCGSGDTKVSGVFVRVESSSGGNNSVTDQSGAYTIKVPANASYTIDAFDPKIGKLRQLTGVDISAGSATGNDIVVGNPSVIVVNAKYSNGNAVSVDELFVDFYDFTNDVGNYLRISSAASGSISLPSGTYRVRASLKGQVLGVSSIDSDSGDTVFATGTAQITVNGVEAIKVTIPTLATITGNVYTGSVLAGNELTDTLIQFTDPSTGIFLSTQTNSTSTYSLKVPLGTYKVLAQKPGYLATPTQQTITASTTVNAVVTQATLAISGTVSINGSAASKGFVRAKGSGFASAQIGSDGTYTLAITNGTWRVYAVSDGYAETEYSSPIAISGSSASNININLTTAVSLSAPKVCRITPSQGGECVDSTNGIKVTIPPSAFGTDTSAGTVTIQETNALQQTSGVKPVGKGFDFTATDSSGNKISSFTSPVTLEFTQTTSTLAATGITTKTKADGTKVTLWSETIKDYDVMLTTVEYLSSTSSLVTNPSEDLSNVSRVRLKALTTHF
ncbi:MAG: carboxypeptidase-like regulatory domain-containing protein, partial [Nanoarchaeota archaeon]|nr:carboxypeptidase-like regulatory domain-containing protein [Nanoarchaeota archaeon]